MTCVTGAARDATTAPHDGRHVHVHVDAVAVAVVARWVAAPAVRCAAHAVAAAHGDGPWQPGCSWSDCPAPSLAAASDSWGKRSADAKEILRTQQKKNQN